MSEKAYRYGFFCSKLLLLLNIKLNIEHQLPVDSVASSTSSQGRIQDLRGATIERPNAALPVNPSLSVVTTRTFHIADVLRSTE